MLSFLREQNNEKVPAPIPAKQQSRPEGTDVGVSAEAQNQEFFTVSSRKKNVRRSTMGFAFLFSLGLLCLFFMIRNSTPKAASAAGSQTDEKQIEIAIARLTGASSEMFSRMDQIIKRFYESSNVLQVQVNELVKNPFEFELFTHPIGEAGADNPQEVDAEVGRGMFEQQQLRQIVKDMQLKSILKMPAGRRNCCMIDDKILYEGDLIKGFKVIQIGDNYVKLKWRDVEGDTEPSTVESERSGGLEVILNLYE